ncbi:MAG: hypothetical protein GY835_09525 [bacterium]|nr:hypothetical protein [bacterium]
MRNPFCIRSKIADPHSFYGHGDLVRKLLDMVASGQCCAVVGERHMGKSSLLAYLADRKVQAAHNVDPGRTLAARIDFGGLQNCSPQELWIEILRSLALAAKDNDIRRLLDRTADREELTFSDFRRALGKVSSWGIRMVLLFDHFKFAVKNPQLDERIFGALRFLTGDTRVTFVTASRLNLLELDQYRVEKVRQKVLDSPFFNIFAEFSIGPLKDCEVAEMLAGSLDEKSVRFAREDVAFLDCIAGRHPYFLQLAAYHLYDELERAGLRRSAAGRSKSLHPPSPTDIVEIRRTVRDHVRQEGARIFLNQWKHSSKVEQQILVALATTPGELPALAGDALNHHLERLERRGLVRRDGNGSAPSCRLFSELLADWIRTNGTGKEPGSGNDS